MFQKVFLQGNFVYNSFRYNGFQFWKEVFKDVDDAEVCHLLAESGDRLGMVARMAALETTKKRPVRGLLAAIGGLRPAYRYTSSSDDDVGGDESESQSVVSTVFDDDEATSVSISTASAPPPPAVATVESTAAATAGSNGPAASLPGEEEEVSRKTKEETDEVEEAVRQEMEAEEEAVRTKQEEEARAEAEEFRHPQLTNLKINISRIFPLSLLSSASAIFTNRLVSCFS
jgi:hypothetical protein